MSETTNPVAVVTGGSRGIGRGIVLGLAREGYDVVLNYASRREAAEEVERLVVDLGRKCTLVQGDISRTEDRLRIRKATEEAMGRVDLLVNNAGIAPRVRKDLLEATEESFDEVLATNLKGPTFLSQLFANWMLELRGRGIIQFPRIVFVTSISANVASPSRGEYCISKAGLAMTAQLFAVRLASESLPVFEVRPGIIDTDMTAPVKEKYDRLIAGGLVPQGRWGTPEDVAKAVVSIAHGDFDFSTGQVIEVGGGFGLRRL
jgi:NAD(P)-dependent dehydrogenase (short-subunit alcohol dehydrogenase family)